jgi:hypothetical protein
MAERFSGKGAVGGQELTLDHSSYVDYAVLCTQLCRRLPLGAIGYRPFIFPDAELRNVSFAVRAPFRSKHANAT